MPAPRPTPSATHEAWLVGQRHWEPAAIGAAWAAGGVVSIASGVIWGAVGDRLGRPRAISLIFGVQALAYLIMALIP